MWSIKFTFTGCSHLAGLVKNTHTHTHTHTHTTFLSLSSSLPPSLHSQRLCALPLWLLIGWELLRGELFHSRWSWKNWPQTHVTTHTHRHTHSWGLCAGWCFSVCVWSGGRRAETWFVCLDVWSSLSLMMMMMMRRRIMTVMKKQLWMLRCPHMFWMPWEKLEGFNFFVCFFLFFFNGCECFPEVAGWRVSDTS